MIWWTLENSDDATIAMFGGLIILTFTFISVVVLIDWIRNKINKKLGRLKKN